MLRLVFVPAALLRGTSVLKCTKIKEIQLLDCSGLGISNSNQLQTSQNWVDFLDLRFNQINSLNLLQLLILFLNLQAINAWEIYILTVGPRKTSCSFSDCELRSTNIVSTTASAQHSTSHTPNANDSPVSYRAPHLHITPNDRPVSYQALHLHITPNNCPWDKVKKENENNAKFKKFVA